jgi:sulfopropanediol 3-dehydrogenase
METIKSGKQTLVEREEETSRAVAEMLSDLERNGMDAVREYSQQFDDWSSDSFELSEAEIRAASDEVSEQAARDIAACQDNVRAFAEAQRRSLRPLEIEPEPGVVLGHRLIPVAAAGSYVPGGVYPLPSSAAMSIIPAKVAGVETVVGCTPPAKGQGPYPATIHAMAQAGADRIFVLGGVQAIALMAFGLGDVEPVDVLCGAGNKYVTEAKRQLFGRCGIDLLAGPSELLVIADDDADPELVAADLLAQAEHDPAAGTCLIAFSRGFADKVVAEVERQLAELPSRDIAEPSWRENGIVLVADDVAEAMRLSDDYAPEHLELHLRETEPFVEGLRNYGSLFVGEETTVAYGDMGIGTNHILPTGRAARYTGGVWVGTFLKTCTVQRTTAAASAAMGEVAGRLCRLEHLPGHARTADLRAERYKQDRKEP